MDVYKGRNPLGELVWIASPGCQLVRICNFGFETSWQL